MKPQVIRIEVLRCVEFYYDQPARHEHDAPITVRSRSIRSLDVPTDAFAGQFYDLIEVTVRHGHQTVTLRDRFNESKIFHYGDAMSLATAKRQYPKERGQILTLEQCGTKRVLRSLFGHWYSLEAGDTVINPRKRERS